MILTCQILVAEQVNLLSKVDIKKGQSFHAILHMDEPRGDPGADAKSVPLDKASSHDVCFELAGECLVPALGEGNVTVQDVPGLFHLETGVGGNVKVSKHLDFRHGSNRLVVVRFEFLADTARGQRIVRIAETTATDASKNNNEVCIEYVYINIVSMCQICVCTCAGHAE